VIAERLLNLFAHGEFFLDHLDGAWRPKFLRSVRDQSLMLLRTVDEAEDGLPRLKCAAAVALAGACVADGRLAARGLRRLVSQVARQILADGGHVSRSPAQLLDAVRLLVMVRQVLPAVEPALDESVDRMLAVLRFLRLGDGTLAVFHGGGEDDVKAIAALLAQDKGKDDTLAHLPQSGYHRLALGQTIVVCDAGRAAQGAMSTRAHASCLSFEMSAGAHRLVVNCGAAGSRHQQWQHALRSTPAHSTLTVNDRSQAQVLAHGLLASLLGQRLVGGPTRVEARRLESAHGVSIDAGHDAYAPEFGLLHQRRMTLSRAGLMLAGADRLIPTGAASARRRRDTPAYAIRFHIHPDVRLSLAQNGSSVILKLPNREGWRFKCAAGTVSVEESIYFGGGSPRRAEQLVIKGSAEGDAIESAWVFEQVGSN
jgi:uncharacterized heparinase superfamily protein